MHTHTTCWRRNHLGYHVLLEIILDSFCDRGFSIHVKRNHLGYQVMLESLVRYIPESTCNTIFCFPVVEESYSMAKFYQYLSIITNSVLSFLAQFIIYIAQYYHQLSFSFISLFFFVSYFSSSSILILFLRFSFCLIILVLVTSFYLCVIIYASSINVEISKLFFSVIISVTHSYHYFSQFPAFHLASLVISFS